MKLSTSTTRRPTPGPAPARHARVSASPSTRSSWRTCPNVNARRNVPRVEGAATQPPNRRRVRPERSTSESSMLSAPSAIANTRLITFRPALRAPGRSGRSSTNRSTRPSSPNRCASVAASATPASDTTRSSSKTTRTWSSPTGPSSCTIKVTSSAGPRLRTQPGKAQLRRSFLLQHRTDPTHPRGGSRLKLGGGDRHAADDQPQGLVLPALRDERELGDLRAAHLDRVQPGVLWDFPKRRPHRRGAAGREREAHPPLAQPHHQLRRVEAAVTARRDLPLSQRQQPLRAADHPQRLGGLDPGLVAAPELARQGAPALRPADHIRVVGQLAVAATARAALAPPVDHALARVQIERHILSPVAPQPALKLIAHPCGSPFDRADMAGLEPVGQLARSRRRRDRLNRPQRRARLIRAQILHIIKAIPANQLRLGDRHHQAARREPPPALLDRRHPADRGK